MHFLDLPVASQGVVDAHISSGWQVIFARRATEAPARADDTDWGGITESEQMVSIHHLELQDITATKEGRYP